MINQILRIKLHLILGAGTVIPVGRSDLTQETANDFRKFEETYGSRIKYVKADASTREGIEALRHELQQLPKLAGIVNSGAVLDDKLFQDIDRENYRKVMAPKMQGKHYTYQIWHLLFKIHFVHQSYIIY